MPDRTLRTLDQLIADGLVTPAAATGLTRIAERYAISLTGPMRDLISDGDTIGPIARQFLPDLREANVHPLELSDPIGDQPHTPLPGIVHRYPDRVLLKVVSVCPVYCRFCFRRDMIGPEHGNGILDDRTVDRALAYIGERREVNEVILTGGDPFILSPRRINRLTKAIGSIDHVTKIRWHTRVPVVEPSRITAEFIAALRTDQASVRVAVHANHSCELTPPAISACNSLRQAGIALLSQTVLLRHINDDAATLAHLMRAFAEVGIQPYYLHHGDLAPGTAHFRTTIAEGKSIVSALAQMLAPEHCPSYVLDLPGGHGKVPVNDANFAMQADGSYLVSAADGSRHSYRDVVEGCSRASDQRSSTGATPLRSRIRLAKRVNR